VARLATACIDPVTRSPKKATAIAARRKAPGRRKSRIAAWATARVGASSRRAARARAASPSVDRVKGTKIAATSAAATTAAAGIVGNGLCADPASEVTRTDPR
jgi:hypothetical protein